MNLAYLIMAHNTPNHLCRLINALNNDNVQFFIHVDKKSDLSQFQVKNTHQNVTFIQDRVSVYWGEFSQVEAIIKLIKAALNSQNKFEYLILISGSDYPLKSAKYIDNFFSQRLGTEFINLVEMPSKEANKNVDRIYKYQFPTIGNHRFYRFIKKVINHILNSILRWQRDYKKVLGELKPYGGSTWWGLTTDACQYILNFIDSNPKLVKFMKNTWLTDEFFFQTIIGNSPFRKNVTRNLTFTQWKQMKNPEYIVTNPEYLDKAQIEILTKSAKVIADDVYGSGELLFARKFRDNSAELTDYIDNWIKETSY